MNEPGEFPDAEQVLVDMLGEFGHSCTFLPVSAKGEFDREKLPIILIAREGGSCDGITDRPSMRVSVLAATRAEAQRVSGKCRMKILDSAGTAPGGVLVDHAREISGVTFLPDIDPQLRPVQSSYVLSFRRC